MQHWDDQDIPDLLDWMGEHLQAGIATISSFERYKKELLGGQLTWAPMHESGEQLEGLGDERRPAAAGSGTQQRWRALSWGVAGRCAA